MEMSRSDLLTLKKLYFHLEETIKDLNLFYCISAKIKKKLFIYKIKTLFFFLHTCKSKMLLPLTTKVK